MRFWKGYTILNLLATGKDAGWVMTILLVCITTFAASSLFKEVMRSFAHAPLRNGGSRLRRIRASRPGDLRP